jgi:hypothetical protein
MFDIYGIIDFRGKCDLLGIKNPFLKYQYYNDISFKEYVIKTPSAKIFYLERRKTTENHFHEDSKHLLIFGFAFSNKNYELLKGKKPKKLSAREVYDLYESHDNNFIHYIKGSFVIIIYDEKKSNLFCISDQLNVLPIYYAYKNDIFLFSSAIKPILDSNLISHKINKAAITEFAIFDYPLGSKTYYKDITMLDYGEILVVNNKGMKRERYFNVDSLFQGKLMKKDESLIALGEALYNSINLHTSGSKKFLLSLTGGFDGRANLALINRNAEDFLCYSYGMPGSRQITIPMEIARRLKINYKPIYLDKDFEVQYEDCALRSLFYSDGTAPILRANYPYAYKQLKEFSDTAITGLFGSEILRPIYNLGIQFNDNSERLFMGRDFNKDLTYSFEHEKNHGYFKTQLFEDSYEEIRDFIWKNYFLPYKDIDKLTRFFFFFISEGIRKYFMQEIRIERVYVNTRFPYFDFDFVKLMYRTPFAGMYNGAMKRSVIKRRRAQLLYAYIINQYKPILGEIITDRGYKPKDLLSPIYYLKIMPGYIRTQLYNRRIGNDAFDSERWTDMIFFKKIELMKKETDMFPGTLFEKYKNKENLRENYYFSRVFSLKYWLENWK